MELQWKEVISEKGEIVEKKESFLEKVEGKQHQEAQKVEEEEDIGGEVWHVVGEVVGVGVGVEVELEAPICMIQVMGGL